MILTVSVSLRRWGWGWGAVPRLGNRKQRKRGTKENQGPSGFFKRIMNIRKVDWMKMTTCPRVFFNVDTLL